MFIMLSSSPTIIFNSIFSGGYTLVKGERRRGEGQGKGCVMAVGDGRLCLYATARLYDDNNTNINDHVIKSLSAVYPQPI